MNPTAYFNLVEPNIKKNILKSGSPKDPSNASLHPMPLLFEVLLQIAEMHMDTELLNISSHPSLNNRLIQTMCQSTC